MTQLDADKIETYSWLSAGQPMHTPPTSGGQLMPDPTGELTSYGELAELLTALPLLLRETRRQRRLSLRAAAKQIGCSFATVSRIESGEDCALSNAMAVLRWLNAAPAPADPVHGSAHPADLAELPEEAS